MRTYTREREAKAYQLRVSSSCTEEEFLLLCHCGSLYTNHQWNHPPLLPLHSCKTLQVQFSCVHPWCVWLCIRNGVGWTGRSGSGRGCWAGAGFMNAFIGRIPCRCNRMERSFRWVLRRKKWSRWCRSLSRGLSFAFHNFTNLQQ